VKNKEQNPHFETTLCPERHALRQLPSNTMSVVNGEIMLFVTGKHLEDRVSLNFIFKL
jgi:hypothetical protein